MPDLLLEDVPQDLYDDLRRAAEVHQQPRRWWLDSGRPATFLFQMILSLPARFLPLAPSPYPDRGSRSRRGWGNHTCRTPLGS